MSDGVWGGFLQRPQQPAKQLMLPRIMNLLLNPFARGYAAGQADPQNAVFRWGGELALDHGLQQFTGAAPPQWPTIEFAPLGPGKTGRSRLLLPDDFVLLFMFASSSVNARGGFRVSVYDVNRRRTLTIRPVNFQNLAGTGSTPLILRAPYAFGRSINNSPPQAKVTVVSLETANSNIQFGFFGVVAPGYRG